MTEKVYCHECRFCIKENNWITVIVSSDEWTRKDKFPKIDKDSLSAFDGYYLFEIDGIEHAQINRYSYHCRFSPPINDYRFAEVEKDFWCGRGERK